MAFQIPDSVLKRAPYPGFAYAGKDQLVLSDPSGNRLGVNEKTMSAKFVVTSEDPDRVGDVIETAGIFLENFRKLPIAFYNHQQFPLPIGKWEDRAGNCTIQPDLQLRRTTGEIFFSQKTREAEQIFALVLEDILRATSIGFNPLSEPERRDESEPNPNSIQVGLRFPRIDLLEISVVGVPAQPTATLLRAHLSRGKLAGSPISPMLVKALESLAEPVRAWSRGATIDTVHFLQFGTQTACGVVSTSMTDNKAEVSCLMCNRVLAAQSGKIMNTRLAGMLTKTDSPRWNKSLSKDFDVSAQPISPSCTEYNWVAKHIGCKVKQLFKNGTFVPSARMGSFLTGLKQILKEHDLVDVRNLSRDTEGPPVYKVIQLNSEKSDDFLIDGIGFYRGTRGKFAINFQPEWGGEYLTIYTSLENKAFNCELIDRAWEWARQNNFLRGEAFALSGEFLKRTDEGWDDVFLEDVNKIALTRTNKQLNNKGKDFQNRGMIFMGPPGSGKTLSGRIIRNTAKATFIWISSRDFHYSGSAGGLAFGFELARELAPSVLFIEDVDNWLYDTSIDLIKTEMDGIARSSGVLTILTTNFPEKLPEALIDRPGRFHDVLLFAYPTPKARRDMLAKWLSGVSDTDIDAAVTKTEGYSGAHLYELAHYAKTLQDYDSLSAPAALIQALKKIEEQKDLITQVQLQGSHYKPRKALKEITEKAMSKKYGKTAPKTFGQVARAKMIAAAKRKEGMAEGSGTAGGYATGDDMHKRIKEEIAHVAETHKETGGEPHDFFYHPEKTYAFHTHKADAPPEHLAAVKADLEAIDGLKEVGQGTEHPPKGEGYEMVHPEQKAWREAEPVTPEGEGKPKVPAETKPDEKAVLADAVNRLFAMIPKEKKDALQDCVSRKIPKLIGEGYPEAQAQAIAFSMCQEKAITKDDMEVGMPEEEEATLPPGAQIAQEFCELFESRRDQLEPETADFWQSIYDDAVAWATARYPNVSFGGEKEPEEAEETEETPEEPVDEGAEQGTPESEEETEEILENYRQAANGNRKAIAPAVVKKLSKANMGTIKEAADHLGDMAEMEIGEPFSRMHKAACKMHHKELTALHEKLSGSPEDDEPADKPAEEKGLDLSAVSKALDVIDKKTETLGGRIGQAWYELSGKRL